MNPSDRLCDECLNRPSRRALVTKGTNTDPTEMNSEWARLCDSTATKAQTNVADQPFYKNYVKALNYINLCHTLINKVARGVDSTDSSKLIMPDIPNFIDLFSKLSNVSENSEVGGSETSSKTVINVNEKQLRSLPKSPPIRRDYEEDTAALKNYQHEQLRQTTELISMIPEIKESQEFLNLEGNLSQNDTNTRIGIREYIDSNESSCEHDSELINTKSCLSCRLPQNDKNRNEDNQRTPSNCTCVENDDPNHRRKTQDCHNVPGSKRLEKKSKPHKSGMSGDNAYNNISEEDLNRFASELLLDRIESNESSPRSYKTGVDDEELPSPKKQGTYITSCYYKKIPYCYPSSYEAGQILTNQQESFQHICNDKPPLQNYDITEVDYYSNMQLSPDHATIMTPNNQSKQEIVGKNVPRGSSQRKNQTHTNRNLESQLANSLGKCEEQPAKHKSQPNSSRYTTPQIITTDIPEVNKQFDDPTRPIDNKKSLLNMLLPSNSSMITADCNSLRAAVLNREVRCPKPSTLQVRSAEIAVPTHKNNLSKINEPSKNLDFETDFSECDTEDLLSDSDEIESELNLLPRFNRKQPRHALELNNKSVTKADQTALSQMEMCTKKGQITKCATDRLKQVRNNTIIGNNTSFRRTRQKIGDDCTENSSMRSSGSDENITVHKSTQCDAKKNGSRGNPRDGRKNR